jgi:hypothetical protein
MVLCGQESAIWEKTDGGSVSVRVCTRKLRPADHKIEGREKQGLFFFGFW